MSGSVLVVDDEAHVLQVMRTFLERAGFSVHTAANGEDGLRIVQQHQPNAVITDYEMPHLNGRELIERVLGFDKQRPCVMFLVTSRTDNELREWVTQTESVFFMEKPASPRRLVQSLKEKLRLLPLETAS